MIKGSRQFLRSKGSAFFRWVDKHSPLIHRSFRHGFPILISSQIRTYFRIMNVSYPDAALPIAEQDVCFSFYESTGKFQCEHQALLGPEETKTFDIAEISGFDSGSEDLQVGYCMYTLRPKAEVYYGSLRGYAQFETSRFVASVHEHTYRIQNMRFFISSRDNLKDMAYLFLHNCYSINAKIKITLCDRPGDPISQRTLKLQSRGSQLHAVKELFPDHLSSPGSEAGLMHIVSKVPLTPTFIYWDRKTGMISAQHH